MPTYYLYCNIHGKSSQEFNTVEEAKVTRRPHRQQNPHNDCVLRIVEKYILRNHDTDNIRTRYVG